LQSPTNASNRFVVASILGVSIIVIGQVPQAFAYVRYYWFDNVLWECFYDDYTGQLIYCNIYHFFTPPGAKDTSPANSTSLLPLQKNVVPFQLPESIPNTVEEANMTSSQLTSIR
jgi:hypothetical protein